LKNNYTVLFILGICLGGIIMFSIIAFRNISSLSDQTAASLPTQDNLPRLIALEPTSVHPQVTPTLVPPTITSEPPPRYVEIPVSSTPTPLTVSSAHEAEIIGYSAEGRPLQLYTFGTGNHQRMIVAGIHGGDEWNTVTLANQLIKYLDHNPDVVPEDVTLFILPSLNPDGEARAHNKYGRVNANGVDLNRNFPVNWRKDWDRSGCWNALSTSGGAGPGSEPETKVLINFIENHDIEVLISYHSAALGVFPGGLPWEADSIRLAKSIAGVSSYPFPPIDTGCTYSGTLADYAVSKGIAAVDLELTNHFDTDFDQNLDILNVLLNFVP
jgi:zinc carboxypeptidase